MREGAVVNQRYTVIGRVILQLPRPHILCQFLASKDPVGPSYPTVTTLCCFSFGAPYFTLRRICNDFSCFSDLTYIQSWGCWFLPFWLRCKHQERQI